MRFEPYRQILEKMQSFEQVKEKVVIDEVKKVEAEIIDMNTGQLDNGMTGEGNPVEPAYTPFTVSIKRSKGQPTAFVTLEDEGDFKRAWFMNTGGDWFLLGSNDSKSLKLERKYTKDIFGLTKENIEEVKDLIRPGVVEKFKTHVL